MKKTKDQVQQEANDALDINGGRGIVVMATGTGKSKIPIDRAKRRYSSNPEFKILVVVPTEKLRDVNWMNEFEKWDASQIYQNNTEKKCYVSINKIHGQHFDMVVLDEVHNITENNSKFFEQNTVGEIVCLTATEPTSFEKRMILQRLQLKPVYTVTLDEAVEWGLISPYAITIIETKLDTVRRTVNIGTKKRPLYQNEFVAYHQVSKKIDYLINTGEKPGYLQMLILKRMRMIYDLETKTKVAEFVLKHIIPEDERTLIFAGGIAQADRLNEHSFHSKTPKTSESFDLFVNEKINRLSSVNSLNEGHNIPNLDNALVVQLNSKELNLVQRIGRIVRFREGHRANIYIIVVKDTVDEVWTNRSLTNFDESNITRLSFEKLKMEY